MAIACMNPVTIPKREPYWTARPIFENRSAGGSIASSITGATTASLTTGATTASSTTGATTASSKVFSVLYHFIQVISIKIQSINPPPSFRTRPAMV